MALRVGWTHACPSCGLCDVNTDYPTPKNINYWWTFGGILTSVWLHKSLPALFCHALHRMSPCLQFGRTYYAERELWLAHPLYHSNGASMFFLAVYIHIFRGMYYGSIKPRKKYFGFWASLSPFDDSRCFLGLCSLGADELVGRNGYNQLWSYPSRRCI